MPRRSTRLPKTVINHGILVILGASWISATTAIAQTTSGGAASSAASQPPSDQLQTRLSELERELARVREQIARAAGASAKLTTLDAPEPTLSERIDALDQSLRVLKREDELRREAEDERARNAPALTAGRDGFSLRSADGAFVLRLRGLAQSDSRSLASDQVDLMADSFVLRRVRPIIEATLFKNFDVRLMPDFGNGQTVLQDAYVDLRFASALRIRAGKQKQPFGLERLVSASDLLLIERALPTAAVGNRDVGVMAHGDVLRGRLSYGFGVFNGVVDGGSADADDRDGKDIVMRLFAHPFRTTTNELLRDVGIGLAYSYGSHRGTVGAPGLATYRSAGQHTFFRYASDGTAVGTTVADGTRQRVSAQGYYYSGRFGLLGEYVQSEQDIRRAVQTGVGTITTWQLAPSWVLTGERATYRGIAPRTTLDRDSGTWGAFELTGRYNRLSLAEDMFPVFANPAAAASTAQGGATGINWYINRNVKLTFNYEETHFNGGAPNGDRRAERAVLSRVQLAF